MLKDRKKLIAIIIGVVVIVAAVIGFCLWRQHETGANEADGQSDTSQTADNGKKDDGDQDGDSGQLTEDEINTLTDIATRYEHAARDWGVDPNSGSSLDLSKQDAQSVLDQIRTPETMDRSALDQLTTMQTTADDHHADDRGRGAERSQRVLPGGCRQRVVQWGSDDARLLA